MKRTLIVATLAAVLTMPALPVQADRCHDALLRVRDGMPAMDARFDAIGRRLERLSQTFVATSERFNTGADRFERKVHDGDASESDRRAFVEMVLGVASDQRYAFQEFVSIYQDNDATWRDRERVLLNALRACATP